MRLFLNLATTAILAGGMACLAADPPAPTMAKVADGPVRNAEQEVVSLAKEMPAELYTFAPKNGAFQDARTFAQQVKHIAFVNYSVAAKMLGEKNPSETGAKENGPDALKGKDEIVKYLQDSFTYSHKAMQTLTAENPMQMIDSPFGDGKMTRLSAANIIAWHTFDHYGQMAVYARMNNVVPPASRQ